MIHRCGSYLITTARLFVVLVILFNPVGPALADALRADELSTPEIKALLFSKTASDFAEGFNLLTDGLDDTLGEIMGLINQVGGLPLIGDRLADAMNPLTQMLDFLGIGAESGFVEIYRTCEGRPDAVTCFENGMYEKFGPDGLNLLMDGIDAGSDVNVTDLVRSSGRDPNWVQYDMHLGIYEELPIPGFEFGANLGVLGDMFKRFGFDVEASGLRAILKCNLYLGFGVHAQDGFYVTSNGVNQYGNEIEELEFSFEVTAKPMEGDEPGIEGDVALGALSTHVTDGTVARAQIIAGEPLASAGVLTQTGDIPGSLIDYTRRFTLTLTGSDGATTTHPVAYSGFGDETFAQFLLNLNTELMAATTGDYGPWPAVYALAYPRLNVSANVTESIGGPVLIFRATTPEVTAMEVQFDPGGDCVTTPSATNDLCAWGFQTRQYEDTRSQGLGFSSGGQVGSGGQITATAPAPVNGILSTDARFNIWLTDAVTAERTRVPVLLRWMATNDDIESLPDLRDRLDAYLNGEGEIAGALSQNDIEYELTVSLTDDHRFRLDCDGHCSEITVDWDPSERSKLMAVAAVDVTDTLYQGGWATRSGPVPHDASPGRLTIPEMRQVEADEDINAFRARFAAEGNLRFHVESNMEHISGFVEQGLGLSEGALGLPEVTYDLKMDLTLKATVNDPNNGTGVSKDLASIQLDNVSLELGTLLDYVVKPMANILGWGLGPVFKVVGEGMEGAQGFVNEPIPLLDEIGPSFGIGQPSILDLTGNKDSLNAFFEAVKNLNSAVVGVAKFMESYDGGPIYFGCWEIDVKKPWPPLPCVVGEVMAKANAEATTVDDLTSMPSWNTATAGFSVDILKPENVIGLLMGSDVDIASFRLPHTDLRAGIDFGVDFDILAFDVDVGAGVELAEIGLVYDTTGLRTMVQAVRAGATPDFGDLLDGFYLATGKESGHDVRLYFEGYGRGEIGGIWEDWWGCEWGLEAGAEIELGGGFFLDVNDLNHDGKLRLDEMLALTDNFSSPLNAFCLFDAGVNIYGGFDFWGEACFCWCASLSASDFGLDSFCRFDVSLSLSDILGPIIDCPADDSSGPPPILATPLPGCESVLRVNSGPFASQRLYGDTDDSDGAQLAIGPADGGVRVSGFGTSQVYPGPFDRILVIGGEGADQIVVSSFLTVPITLLGMDGDDTLTGGGAADLVEGGAGADRLHGGPGSDLLNGGAGDDTLHGDDGQDVLHGHDGGDDLYGDGGSDRLYGDLGADTLHGGDDTDLLDGGRDDDTLHGDGGDDLLHGSQDDDTLHGGPGGDRLYGGSGDDLLHGDGGGDTLHGDAGTDALHGGDDDDRLFGDSGFDTLNGDGGDDALHGGPGDDRLDGGPGSDRLHGDDGEDTLVDGVGDDALYGGIGDDRVGVHALLGDTWIQGDEGFDTLIYDTTQVETTPLTPTLTGEALLAHYSVTATQLISARLYLHRPVTDVLLITVTESFSAAVYTLGDPISVTLGDGDDRFVVAGPALPLTMTTGGGDDAVTIDALSGPTTVDVGSAGHDTVWVYGINAATTITTTGADFDVIASSRAHRLNLIQASLTADGTGGGQTRLLVQETGATAHRPAVQLTGHTLIGLGAAGAIGYYGLDELTLALGAGDDTIHATGPSAVQTTLDGGFGSNTLHLAPQSATFPRTVSTDRLAQVTVDNTASSMDAAWTLTRAGAAGVVEATTLDLTLLSTGVDQAWLTLGPGADSVAIQDVPFTTTVSGGGGGDQFDVGDMLAGPIPLTLSGGPGDDTLIAVQNDPGSIAHPYASLVFDAIEAVCVDSSGSAGATDWLVDGNSAISVQAVEILDLTGRGVETVRIEAGAGSADTLTWANGPTGRVTIHGDAAAASASALEFSQIEALTLTTGAGGDDTVILRDVDAPLGLVTIHTGDGSDTVSVQKAGPDQRTAVTLGTGQDSFYLRELAADSTTTVNGGGDDDVFRIHAIGLDSAVTVDGSVGADGLVFDSQGYTATMTMPATPSGRITITNGPAETLTYVNVDSAQILTDAPVVVITPTTPTAAGAPLVLAVAARVQPTGSVTYTWDLDGDGAFGDVPSQTGALTETVVLTVPWSTLQTLGLEEAGAYVVTARATDSQTRAGEGSAVVIISGTVRYASQTGWPGWQTTSSAYRAPGASRAYDALTLLAVTYAGPDDGPPVEVAPVTVTVVAAGAPTYVYSFDWYGDGTDVFSYSNTTGAGTAAHVYPDDGLYPLVVTVRDGSRPVSETTAVSETLWVRVANVPPQFTVSGGTDSLNEGETYHVTLGSAGGDPGPDTVVSYTVSWGDGVVTTVASGTAALHHTYADDGEFFVTAAARDEDGLFPAQNALRVTVENITPTLSLSDGGVVDEGSPYTLTLTASDPGDDAISSWRVDWGDDWIETVGSGITSTRHIYADDGEYAVAVAAADEDGAYPVSGALTRTAAIRNISPRISIAPNPEMTTPIPEGAWYKLDLIACGDPGDDTLTRWTIDWGDDLMVARRGYTPYAVAEINTTSVITGNNPSQAQHRFPEGPAVYTVTVVSASDEDGVYTSTSWVRVEVSDTPPTITMRAPNAPREGLPYTLTLEMIDPGADLVDRWEIAWGDGEQTVILGALDPAEHHTYAETHAVTATRYVTTHIYPDNGIYAGAVTMYQTNGIAVTADLSVTVRNVVPQVYLTGQPRLDADQPFTLTIGAVTDPGDDTVTEYRINWNDEAAVETFTGPGNVAHMFTDERDVHLIRASLVDEDIVGTDPGEYRSVGLLPVINEGAPYQVPLSLDRVLTYADATATPGDLDLGLLGALDRGVISDTLRQWFSNHGIALSGNASVAPLSHDPLAVDGTWRLVDVITYTTLITPTPPATHTTSVTHVVAHTYTLQARMDAPAYVSFAPLDVRFGYELGVYAEPTHTLQFSTTDVILAWAAHADLGLLDDLDRGGIISNELRQVFSETISLTLSLTATVTPLVKGSQWRLDDREETYIIILGRDIGLTYNSFDPADIPLDYELFVFGEKRYQVDWGDGITETYTVANDYEIFLDTLSLAPATRYVLQLNARHIYRTVGVYTVTFSVVDAAGQPRPFHTYPVVVNYSRIHKIRLPLVMRNYATAPDLVVRDLSAASDAITVVVENRGSASVRDGFWVMGYVAPDPVPDSVNQVWYYGYSDYGVSWAVDDPELAALSPGGALTLTLADAYPPPYTQLPAMLTAGVPVYVQLDAYHPDTDYGAVLELDEILGLPYNNITATVSVGGAGVIDSAVRSEVTGDPRRLPPLPRLDSKRILWSDKRQCVKIPGGPISGWKAGLLPAIIREE